MKDYTNLNTTRKEIIRNMILASFGLFVFAIGVYLTIQANIGVAPWDVLNIGISKSLGILYGPAKAANAGGVSVSQLEMAQNAHMVHWTFDEVDNRLKGIMHNIYTRAAETAKEFGSPDNLLLGANISAFREVADAMILQGDY